MEFRQAYRITPYISAPASIPAAIAAAICALQNAPFYEPFLCSLTTMQFLSHALYIRDSQSV